MIRVLIVDDSPLVRGALAAALETDPDISVVGEAGDPFEAREQIAALTPDVVTLDVQMPRMDGLTFLARLMEHHPVPVIMFSTLTAQGSAEARRALELGAVDVIAKPQSPEDTKRAYRMVTQSVRAAAASVRAAAASVRAAAAARRAAPGPQKTPSAPLPATRPPAAASPLAGAPIHDLIAIGASTGGTVAIAELLGQLPADTPGIVMAQHMPRDFTQPFADRLDQISPMRVRQAEHGDRVEPGLALLAPGGRHMVLAGGAGRYHVELHDGPRVHHQRPAVDVLFRSVAKHAAPIAVGVVLTGMGADGADGLLAMREAGARTFAQDEASSVVYGMPREALLNGGAERAVPLTVMGATLLDALRGRGARSSKPPGV